MNLPAPIYQKTMTSWPNGCGGITYQNCTAGIVTVLYLEQTSISSAKTLVSDAALIDEVQLGSFMLSRFLVHFCNDNYAQ